MRPKPERVFSLGPPPADPGQRRWLPGVRPALEWMLGLARLERCYDERRPGLAGVDFAEWALEILEIRVTACRADLDRLPRTGPAVVVANHPFGAVEGLALGKLLGRRRPDVKILANYLLCRIPELRALFLAVDPFGVAGSARVNFSSLRRAVRWVSEGGLLVVFPAGEVSHLDLRSGRVTDPTWSPAAAGILRRTGCPALPVFFPGRNRASFQLAGLLHPRLRTALLARELLARRGSTIELRIGSAIAPAQVAAHADDADATGYLRSRVYILSQRRQATSPSGPPMQPRSTPPGARPLVPPVPPAALQAEVAALPADRLLIETGDQAVYVASANQIPDLLREIGRLRELTFRAVGEGTGREIDLDLFDERYLHLFVWGRSRREVVGSYRIGKTDELLRDGGTAGLYTSTLFGFKPQLFSSMGPALEMGRSFVRLEHQKSYAPLLLLWKGIGRFVLANPRYATLFGPVSISAEYQSASQRLIVAFLEQNRYAHEWSRWVRPKAPCRLPRSEPGRPSPAYLRNLDDVSSYISEIEADQKGVPILLKQYLKLGGRLLGFNVDPDFSNVLDVLIMVDLRQTAPRILSRYMGTEEARAFLAQHRSARPAAV